MRVVFRLWIVILTIVLVWIYFIFISPIIFNNKIIEIPNLEGMDQIEAEKQFNQMGIKYQITYIESDKEEVIKTIPYAGTKIKKNNIVSIYIGKIYPPKYRSYLGSVYDEVKEEIQVMCNNFGMNLKIEFEDVDNIISGLIIKESLTDGGILNNGDELILTISVNNSTFLMPNLVGLNVDEAVEIITELNMNVNIIYYQTPIDPDVVLFQSVEAETLISKKNQYIVDIYVSKIISNYASIDVDFIVEVMVKLNYDVEVIHIESNGNKNKLIAFEKQKLYDSNIVKYKIWITD